MQRKNNGITDGKSCSRKRQKLQSRGLPGDGGNAEGRSNLVGYIDIVNFVCFHFV